MISTRASETVLSKCRRGEIWLVDLNPQGRPEEIAKSDRPCLVIQSDLINDSGYPTTLIIPCTTSTYRDAQGDGFPFKIGIGKVQKPGEKPEETDAFVAGARAIANSRFKGEKPIARLERNHMKRIEDALKLVLGM